MNILVLHGWGGSKKSWDNFVGCFDNKRYKFFVPDLPGFGDEPAPDRPWYVHDYAEWVEKYMKKKKLVKPIIVAHSFGGRIAIKMCSKDKNAFSRLFLVAAAGIKRPPSMKVRVFTGVAKVGKFVLGLFKLQSVQTFFKKVVYKAAGTHDYEQATGTMKQTFKNIIDEDLKDLLDDIRVKTHIIWGDRDSYVPVADAKIMGKRIKGSTVEIIKHGKHGLHLQMPEVFAEKVKKHINE
ncbi:MAG: alpha/beta hydrolase [Nitrospirota bacterium]